MDALAMGSYGAYVWSCFVLTFVVVVIAELRSRAHHNRVYREIRTRIRALEDDT